MKPPEILVIDDSFGNPKNGKADRDEIVKDLRAIQLDCNSDNGTIAFKDGDDRSSEPRVALAFPQAQKIKDGVVVNDVDHILQLVKSPPTQWALVLLDVQFSSGKIDENGVPEGGKPGDEDFGELVRDKLREKYPDLPIVMLTSKHQGDLRNPDFPFFSKSDLTEGKRVEDTLLEHGRLCPDQWRHLAGIAEGVVIESRLMQKVFVQARRYSSSNAPILLTGDTGVGKEVVAKYIHEQSKADGEFVAVNVTSFSPTLLESELFGHEKGAFTGADTKKDGFFAEAGRGTLFLDEIDKLDGSSQTTLLRVIAEKKFFPVGGREERKFAGRFVFAGSTDMTSAENMLPDLYHRISGNTIRVPSLKERRDDILPLAQSFLHQFARKEKKPGIKLSEEAGEALKNFSFPGNVRQLEQLINSCVLQSTSQSLLSRDDIEESYGSDTPTHGPFLLEDIEKILKAVAVNADDEAALNSIMPGVIESVRLLYRRIIGAGLKRNNNEKKAAVLMLWGEGDVSQPDGKLLKLLGGRRGEFSPEVLKKMVDEYENGQH